MRTKGTMKPFQDISEHEGFIFVFIVSCVSLHFSIMKLLPTDNIAKTNTEQKSKKYLSKVPTWKKNNNGSNAEKSKPKLRRTIARETFHKTLESDHVLWKPFRKMM